MGSNTNLYFMVVGILVLFVAISLPRLLRRGSRSSPPPGSFDAPGAEVRGELERLLTEIQDLSREQVAKLDTKIRILNQLLMECDQKKKDLEALLARVAGAGMARLEPPPPPRPSNPLHDQVYSLQDQGKDLGDICTATGLEKGEVELIIGLRKMPPAGR